MFKRILSTIDSFAPTLLRLALGGVMFPHGAQKLLGWFGGHGYAATIKSFTEDMQIPYLLALAVIITEFFGAILLLAGFLTRVWALGFAILMTVAAVKVHMAYGFFMNWSGNQKGEGFEYHLLAFGMALALLIWGGGSLSVDGVLAQKKAAKNKE